MDLAVYCVPIIEIIGGKQRLGFNYIFLAAVSNIHIVYLHGQLSCVL